MMRIPRKAHRLLRPGGKYGIHEMCVVPDDAGGAIRREIERRVSLDIHVDVQPLGLDVSETIVRIARRHLETWTDRAEVRLTAGEIQLPATSGSADRVVVNYVLDLMSEDAIRAFLTDAHRALELGGLLCIASLTHGATPLARLISRLWARVHKRGARQSPVGVDQSW